MAGEDRLRGLTHRNPKGAQASFAPASRSFTARRPGGVGLPEVATLSDSRPAAAAGRTFPAPDYAPVACSRSASATAAKDLSPGN